MSKTPGKGGKRGNTTTGPIKLQGLEEVKRLWKTVNPKVWFGILQELAPRNKWEMKGHNTVVGCCPYHDDATPSFNLSFAKAMGKCFGCGKYVHDIVSLVAKIRQCEYTEALIWLSTKLDLSKIIGANTEELNKYYQVQEMKKEAAIAMNRLLTTIVRDAPDYLAYCRAAMAYFVTVRKIPVDSIPGLPIGVFGKPEHVKKFFSAGKAHLFPLYDDYFAKNASMHGSLMFHYNDSPGTISKFKVRIIPQDIIAECAKKYPTWQEVPEAEAAGFAERSSTIFIDDPYAQRTGVFGLYRYQPMVGNNDANCYVTEGEFDALSVMVGQDSVNRPDFMILANSGTGNTDLGFLRDFGVRTLWLVQDHPAKNGDEWAKAILKNRHNFTNDVATKPLNVKLFSWPAGIRGLDLDEAVRIQGYETMASFLYRDRNTYFINANPWVSERCDFEIAEIKAKAQNTLEEMSADIDNPEDLGIAKRNIVDDQRSAIKTVLLNWLTYIHDPTEKVVFVQKYKTSENIDLEQIDSVNASMYSLDTMEGAAEATRNAIDQIFSIAYYDYRVSGNLFYAWSKPKQELVVLQLGEKSARRVFEQTVGQDLVAWADSFLKNSSIYTANLDECKTEMDRYRKKLGNFYCILDAAQAPLLAGAKNKADLTTFAAGVHHLDLPAEHKRNGTVFFVNGKHIFKGTYNRELEVLEWERVDNVVDGHVMFRISGGMKWSHAEDVADLYAGRNVDLADLYGKIRRILDAWKFENHDVMADYMAAYIMSVPVQRAVGDVTITFLTGEHESGKTSLINGLIGGTMARSTENKVPTILEGAVAGTDASAAGMYQRMDGSSLLFLIDEAENPTNTRNKSSKSERLVDIMALLNSLPNGGLSMLRGGATQDGQVEYHLRMPVFMAAIAPPSDPVFLSRVFMLHTTKDPGREPPDLYIRSLFNQDEVAQIQKDVTTGLLHKIPDLVARRAELHKKLVAASRGVAIVSTRFVDAVITPLLVYELLGKDPVELFLRVLRVNKARLESIHGNDLQSDIINACLYTRDIRVNSDDGVADLVNARSLIIAGQYEVLNKSNTGVYFLAEKEWIVVVWREAKFGILKYQPWSHWDDSTIKERIGGNPFVVHKVSDADHLLVQNRLDLPDMKSPAGYTAIDVTYLIAAKQNDAEKAAEIRANRAKEKALQDGSAPEPTAIGGDSRSAKAPYCETITAGQQSASTDKQSPELDKPAPAGTPLGDVWF